MTTATDLTALELVAKASHKYRQGDTAAAYAMACDAREQAEREQLDASKQALIAGWYGYLLGIEGGKLDTGLDICREAAKKVFWEAYIYENLAKLESIVGSRQRAVAALNKGLRLFPDNPYLLDLQKQMGVREKQPVGFLKRSHPVNNALGRMMRRNTTIDVESGEVSSSDGAFPDGESGGDDSAS